MNESSFRQIDPFTYTSSKISLEAPQWLAAKLLNEIVLSEESKVDDTAIRFFTNAVLATNLLGLHQKTPLWVRSLDSILRTKKVNSLPVQSSPSKLQVLTLPGVVFVSIPRVEVHADELAIINEINDLQETLGDMRDWVLDFSDVTNASLTLFGFLTGFQIALEQSGKRAWILWLRKDVISGTVEKSLKSRFLLMRKGAFLLSRLKGREASVI